jgi:hypothetical protein
MICESVDLISKQKSSGKSPSGDTGHFKSISFFS